MAMAEAVTPLPLLCSVRFLLSSLFDCYYIAVGKSFVCKFLSYAWTLWDIVIPLHRDIIVFACGDIVRQQRAGMQFMNDEVRDNCFQLKCGSRRNRRSAAMSLHTYIISMRHIAYFFTFCYTACVAKVGLNNGNGTVFQERAVAPAAVNTFTRGERNFDLCCNFRKQRRIHWRSRLFIVEAVKFLKSLS